MANNIISWIKPLEGRRSFSLWKIPADLHRKYGLEDKMRFPVEIDCGAFYLRRIFTIVSGLELSLRKREQASLLKNISGQQSVHFRLDLSGGTQISLTETDTRKNAINSHTVRLDRLKKKPPKPKSYLITVRVFARDPDVVAAVLHESRSKCERCKSDAPFLRASDGSPYLEVHHKTRLIDDGDDTVDNCEALCPNCHRKAHHG